MLTRALRWVRAGWLVRLVGLWDVCAVQCPDEERIAQFARGELTLSDEQAFELHIDGCESCAQVVAWLVDLSGSGAPAGAQAVPSISGLSGLSDASVTDAGWGQVPRRALDAGALLGRYRVIEKIGEGGMGVVYLAHDPELNRKVAIKLLRPAPHAKASDSRGRRMQREAQALARLSHPNVVAVHDVGRFEDRVFIAMQYVAGQTLGQWVRERKRTWSELRPVFVAAGRGLVAAHTAGIVHRDFKPDNVLIDEGGGVKVTDFGLARIGMDDAEFEQLQPSVSSLTTVNLNTLTGTGALVGTPAYMAPEQFRTAASTTASDQYSFCVALYEAVYGARPFPATAIAELAQRVLHADLPSPPRSGVPTGVRAAILRGLARDPRQRFASMGELLAQISPRVRWRMPAAGAAGVGVLAAVGIWQAVGVAPARVCPRDSMAEAWGDGQRDKVREAFVAAGQRAYGEGVWTNIRPRLDAYALGLSDAQFAACEGAGTLADRGLGPLRATCLVRARQAFEAAVEVLADADVTTVHNAAHMVEGLRRIELCQDSDALTRPQPVGPQLHQVAVVERMQGELARAEAMLTAGRYTDALTALDGLAQDVRAPGYLPLEARFLVLRGRAADLSGDSARAVSELFEAAAIAAQAQDHVQAAAAWNSLAFVLGVVEGDRVGAGRALRQAQAAVELLDDDAARAGWLTNSASLKQADGNAASALQDLAQAREIHERLGNRAGQLAVIYNQGAIETVAMNLDAAQGYLRESLELATSLMGQEHPEVADIYLALGQLHGRRGQHTVAKDYLSKARGIRERSLGTAHPEFARALMLLSINARRLEQDAAAVQYAEQALDILIASVGPHHLTTSTARGVWADAVLVQGRYREAEVAIRFALEQTEPPMTGWARAEMSASLAQCYLSGGYGDPEPSATTALEGCEARFGMDSEMLLVPLVALARAVDRAGRKDEALDLLNRALELVARENTNAGLVHFRWAQVAWHRPELREQAIHSAQRGRRTLRSQGLDVDEIDQWLAQRRPMFDGGDRTPEVP